MNKQTYKRWSKKRLVSYMQKHWKKWAGKDACKQIAKMSEWSPHTIKKLRTELKLVDNRVNHERNKI